MSVESTSETRATPAAVISPPPIHDHHASPNIHTERAKQHVNFNAPGTNEFRLIRMEDANDEGFTTKTREIFIEYIKGLGIDMAFQDINAELAELPGWKYSTPGGGALFVLEHIESGELAGCCAVKDLGDGIAEAKRLFVRPAYRGKDLGRLLLVHIIDVASQSGYDRIRLDTLARFTQANALYGLLGFKRIDPYNFNPQDDVLYFELENSLKDDGYRKGHEDAFAFEPRRREVRK